MNKRTVKVCSIRRKTISTQGLEFRIHGLQIPAVIFQ